MSFILVLFFIGFLFYNPAVYFYCLLFSFKLRVVSHPFCATKYKIVSWVWTILYTVVPCTKTDLFCLIEVNCSNFLCIFYFINCKLRFPSFLQVLNFNFIALNINVSFSFSFLHFFIRWISFNNSNIVLKNKKFFTTKK